ncbi:MAG: RNA polymerase sigma factor [Rhodospirillaceae bacterium]|nr:RNA polymerase sigma factor [Rhodospirillaceae bacterium]
MTGVSQDRAAWLARHVLPHEAALRAWLRQKYTLGVEVDDIVQETYAILAGLESVEAIRNPRSYAFQTAHSLILAHLRRSKIVSIRSASDLELAGAMADTPTPEQVAADRDELANVARVLSDLPPKVREVILLRRVQGLSQRETAERLGITENSVEKRISQGIRALLAAFGRGGKRAVNPLRSDEGPENGEPWRRRDKDSE